MQSGMTSMGRGKPSVNLVELKRWVPADALNQAPSLMDDYKNLAAARPGNAYYDANVRHYMEAWKKYWSDFIPQMIATRKVPDGAAWGHYPVLSSSVTSKASEVYNVMVHSLTPAAIKGIVFIHSPEMVKNDHGANYGEQLSVLASNWKEKFSGKDPHFFYTMPGKETAPKITKPTKIKGRSTGVEVKKNAELIERVISEAY